MSTTRITHDGTVDLIGERFGTLLVDGIAPRAGHERRFTVRCEICNSQGVARYSQLRNGAAKCLNANCGKPTGRRRERLEESQELIAKRQAELAEAQQRASAARMEFESADFEPTVSFAERQAAILRERRDQEERERVEAEQRAAEAPRLEAEREAAEQREKQEAEKRKREEARRAYECDWVLTDRDVKLYVTDAMRSAKMPKAEAEKFTAKAAEQFAGSPEYAPYRTPENADIILGYLHRNGVYIADSETIRGAFVRLRDLGLLKKKPSPAPQPKPVEQATTVNLTIEPAPSKPEPVMFDGWDEDGNPRQYSEREVSRWSSEEMKRRLRLYPEKLTLPNVGPGPVTRKQRGDP